MRERQSSHRGHDGFLFSSQAWCICTAYKTVQNPSSIIQEIGYDNVCFISKPEESQHYDALGGWTACKAVTVTSVFVLFKEGGVIDPNHNTMIKDFRAFESSHSSNHLCFFEIEWRNRRKAVFMLLSKLSKQVALACVWLGNAVPCWVTSCRILAKVEAILSFCWSQKGGLI